MSRPSHLGYILAEVLQAEYPKAKGLPVVSTKIVNRARAHHRLQLEECNGDLREARGGYDSWRDWLTNATEAAEVHIRQLVSEVDEELRVEFGHDPRGNTVKLFLPSGRYNSWGGTEEGWRVEI